MGSRLAALVLLLLVSTLLSDVSANVNNINKNLHDEDTAAGSGLAAWIINTKAIVSSLLSGAFQAPTTEKGILLPLLIIF